MPDCDYCGETFEEDDAYLDHLAAVHEGDLSAIDQRRVADRSNDDDGVPTATVALVAVGVVGLAALVGVFFLGGGSGPGEQTTRGDVTAEGNTIVSFSGSAPDGIETDPLPPSGREDVISVVAEEPYGGSIDHVDPSQLNYDPSSPPTAGPHAPNPTPAGFYTTDEAPADPQVLLAGVVHSLEHGAVVVYYDPEAITPAARESLQTFAQQHTGPWQSVVVVPHPGEPDAPYVLTAWEHRLKLTEYDARAVRAFVAEYIGRGPENPVRGEEPP